MVEVNSLSPVPAITGIAPWVRIVRESNASKKYSRTERPAISSPRSIYELLSAKLEREEQEVFTVISLDTQRRVIAISEVTRGILNSSLVHPRESFRLAIALGAAMIAIAHNHPSGDPTPSNDDRVVTAQHIAAGQLLDIPVLDHVIVGERRYVSFAEAGLL